MTPIAFNPGRGDARAAPSAAQSGDKAAGDDTGFAALISDFAGGRSEEASASGEGKEAAGANRPSHRASRHHIGLRRAQMPTEAAGSNEANLAAADSALAALLPATIEGETDTPDLASIVAESGTTPRTRAARFSPTALHSLANTGSIGAAESSGTDGSSSESPSMDQPLAVTVVDRRTDFAPVRAAFGEKAALATATRADETPVPEPAAEKTPTIKPQPHLAVREDVADRPPSAPSSRASASRDSLDPADRSQSPSVADRSIEPVETQAKDPAAAGPAPASTQTVRIATAILDEASDILSVAPAAKSDAPDASSSAGAVRSLAIQLHPANLGLVTVHMALRGDQLALHFRASRAETVQLLDEDKDRLSQILNGAGYRTEISGIAVDTAVPPASAVAADQKLFGNAPQQRNDAGGGALGDRSGGLPQDGQSRDGQGGRSFMRDKEEIHDTPHNAVRGGGLYV